MKESLGNAFLFNLIIAFTLIFIALFSASLIYSKAYKFKNRIVDIIESNQIKNKSRGEIIAEIDEILTDFGYRMDDAGCESNESFRNSSLKPTENIMETLHNDTYRVCIYKIENDQTKMFYYKVIVYMYLDLPLVGDLIQIPLKGETRSFNTGITVY